MPSLCGITHSIIIGEQISHPDYTRLYRRSCASAQNVLRLMRIVGTTWGQDPSAVYRDPRPRRISRALIAFGIQ